MKPIDPQTVFWIAAAICWPLAGLVLSLLLLLVAGWLLEWKAKQTLAKPENHGTGSPLEFTEGP